MSQDSGPNVAALERIASGFFAANVLAAAVTVDMFSTLSVPRTADDAVTGMGLSTRYGGLFLAACAELGLIERDQAGRYRNTGLASTFLLPGPSGYFGDFGTLVSRDHHLPWLRLVELLRTGRPVRRVAGSGLASSWDDPAAALLRTFWPVVRPQSEAIGHALSQAVDFRGRRRLLDVAGGSAPYTISLCQDNPQLAATVYEMPWVGELAAKHIAAADLSDRIDVVLGDFRTGELPAGHDAAIIANVLHSWDTETRQRLLKRIHQVLRPGGMIVVLEPFQEPVGDAEGAAVVRLAMTLETGSGRSYSVTEHADALAAAGFADCSVVPLPGTMITTEVVVAHRH